MIKCIVIEDEPLAKKGIEEHISRIPFLTLLGSFENPILAASFLARNEVDLILSDIQMPEISGIDFLKNLSRPPLFIFITGNPEHAVESYDLEVLDYILKPFTFERLLKSVTKAQKSLTSSERPSANKKAMLTVRDKYRNYLVSYDDIHYVEGYKEYIKIITTENEHLVFDTLKHMEATLPTEQFMRVQKSYIINTNYVKAVDPDKIIMQGSIQDIPLGHSYRNEVYKRFNIMIKR